MSIENEYFGFLKSHPLTIQGILPDIPLFDFENLVIGQQIQTDVSKLKINVNEVLGKRVEVFFDSYIKNSDRYSIIAKNIQVFNEKITIGEIDFIIKDLKKDQVLHVELVYKFYLYDPVIEGELNRWIGPNRNDTLLKKAEKLEKKQFPLLYTDQAKKVLKNLKLDPNIMHQNLGFMANLFLPVSMKNKLFSYLNNDCIVGFWLHKESFTQEDYGLHTYNIPTKKDWIVDPKFCNSADWKSFTDIESHILKLLSEKKSPLVWLKTNEDRFQRFFIVWW